RHAVLDRIAGVEGLDLRVDRGGNYALGNAIQPHERRVSNRIQNRVARLFVGHKVSSAHYLMKRGRALRTPPLRSATLTERCELAPRRSERRERERSRRRQ